MSDFRKVILALAVVALMATSAFAQSTPINCSVQASNPTVRVEGITELVGDMYIRCTGLLLSTFQVAGTAVPTVTVLVNYNAPITNRVVGGGRMTDALLFIGYDDNDALNGDPGLSENNVNPCPAGTEDSNTGQCPNLVSNTNPLIPGMARSTANATTLSHVNVFQGIIQSATTIQFTSVPFSQYPAVAAPACGGAITSGIGPNCPFVRVFRVKNVRLGIAGNLSNNSPVSASVFFTNPAQPTPNSLSNIIFSNNTQQVGFVNTGVEFARHTAGGGTSLPVGFAQCVLNNVRLATSVADRYFGSSPDTAGGRTANVRFTEGFPSAFKTRLRLNTLGVIVDHKVPSEQYQARFESGWFNPAIAALNGNFLRVGYSDTGTRLRTTFSGVPTGVRVYTTAAAVPNAGSNTITSPTVQAYSVFADVNGANQSPANGPNAATVFRQATSTPIPTTAAGDCATWEIAIGGAAVLNPAAPNVGACVVQNIDPGAAVPPGVKGALQGLNLVDMPPVATGTMTGTATWEVIVADPAVLERISFGVAIAYNVRNLPLTTISVAGSLAPISTVTGQSSNVLVPLPRFVDTGSAASLVTIVPCVTNLLYPFVTAVPGFNTGIAIANTSDVSTTSSSGTVTTIPGVSSVSQSGPCTMYYYGEGPAGAAAPSPQTSGVVPAGKVLVFNVAGGSANYGTINGTPGFQGYVIAQCQFWYAHGYAFISDNNLALFAQGYLALILDNSLLGNRAGQAEILGN